MIKQLFTFDVRACLNCGSFFSYELDLCYPCRLRLFEISTFEDTLISKKVFIKQSALTSKSLFIWNPDLNRPLSLLIENLKGEKQKHAWRSLAKEFQVRYMANFVVKRPLVFLPCPNATQKQDHAFYFCKYLAEGFSGTFAPFLQKNPAENKQSQKSLSKLKRQAIQLSTNENFTMDFVRRHKIIFVDDVITTGATAAAAYIALKKPPDFEVWSLAYRPLAVNPKI